ncbi:hypothetical protein [Levilactobacillus brevis]|uniref:hypothetical protein n=1 Tax=Levilactobacillus brevis TaxID=1580 RepID=UPI0021A5EF60|nr:hypothetical protein [Levilactobacillus brevis]MCT3575492.1 hypothetical protein [Levilactobacillus brevis]
MNRKRSISVWLNLALAFTILVIAIGNGVSILAANNGREPGPWGIRWIFVNIEMWVSFFWAFLVFFRRIPNWILCIVGLVEVALFIYLNFYLQYFYWIQDLILVSVCVFFAYGTYSDYRTE